jgi:hypothetical protein
MVQTSAMNPLAYRPAIESRCGLGPPEVNTTGCPCSDGGIARGPLDATCSPCRLIGRSFDESMKRFPGWSLTQASGSQLPHSAWAIWMTSWARP